jgi:phosphoglycolate phosphatase/pyrophosphatase PpaX
MKKLKAVIFDLDGTIGNTLPVCFQAFRLSLEPLLERPLSDEELYAHFGPSEEGMISKLVPAHYEKAITAYLYHYETEHTMCPAPFEGMEAILTELRKKGLRLGLVTGKGPHSCAISLRQFGLAHHFEHVEVGDPNGPRKPRGMQAVLDRFTGISKEEVIYVGDAPSDIHASRQVGIPVVSAAWAETARTEQLRALEPDEIFYTIPDFSDWLFSRC